MPKGPRITDSVRKIIAEVYLQHPDWRAKDLLREVHLRLRQREAQAPPNWPGISIVQQEVKTLKARHQQIESGGRGLDAPWSIATLPKYDIPAPALPAVIDIQKHRWDRRHERLSIREARWVSRLYALFHDAEELDSKCRVYAFRELTGELSGQADDSFDIDLMAPSREGETAELAPAPASVIPDPLLSYEVDSPAARAQRTERLAGVDLEKPDLPGDAWKPYQLWLDVVFASNDWANLSHTMKRQLVIWLRNWIKDRYPDFQDKIHDDIVKDAGDHPVLKLREYFKEYLEKRPPPGG